MTWFRKTEALVAALVVFAVFLIPISDWIDSFLGAAFS
jgi:hypothetical protein